MESIYYVLIILGISFGLIVLYIILRSMNVIGAIPILSNIVDPILNAPFQTRNALIMDDKINNTTKNEIIELIRAGHTEKLRNPDPEGFDDSNVRVDVGYRHIFYDPKTGKFVATGLELSGENENGGEYVNSSSPEGSDQIYGGSAHGNINKGNLTITGYDWNEYNQPWETKHNIKIKKSK